MININIKGLLGNGEMAYDTLFTEGTFEWFKSDEDAFIYVRNNETGRCSRYNAEAQNGKRISADVYESNKIRAKARQDEENGDALTEEELESATREVEEMISNGEIIDYKGNLIPVRGGAWEDPMNSCFYTVIDHVDGHDICTENSNGEVFALRNFSAKAPEVEEAKEIADLYCRHPEGTDLQKPAVVNQYGCVDCSKCNVQNCVHRDCMRRNPTSVGGLGLCPRLNVEPTEEPTAPKEPKAPKAKRVRKPKDIGHTSAAVEGVTLTAKQVDFIRHLPDTCFWEHGLDSAIWVDCLCDDIGGQFKGKPMTVGAMISTLCEKGLGTRCKQRVNGKKATSFELTENGKLVAAELGLN